MCNRICFLSSSVVLLLSTGRVPRSGPLGYTADKIFILLLLLSLLLRLLLLRVVVVVVVVAVVAVVPGG